MADGYLDIAITPSVVAAQDANGSRAALSRFADQRQFEGLTQVETDFIAARDSFYMATVSETGWPYVQHRGGPVGFLQVVDNRRLAFADFRGNRQYISLGNLAVNNRAALILMDYPNRRRLKIYAHAEEKRLDEEQSLAEILKKQGYKAKAERAFVLNVDAFDWNCPQHIVPRFTAHEVEVALAPIRARLAQLEAENRDLRQRIGEERLDASEKTTSE
jgi:predicted pyridoxine 5'-phosphate oxidase superfamily flavin-nucleotide-binding protein